MIFQAVGETFNVVDRAAYHVPLGLVILGSVLLIWRLWAFTIKPALNPAHPKELPYWVPWLGHAIAFVSENQKLLRRARLYFDKTREPFFLTLGGQRIYVFTAPEDVALLYRDSDAFTFDEVVFNFTNQFGVSKDTLTKIYQDPKTQDDSVALKLGFANPHMKSMAHLNDDFLKKQLLPGEQFEQLAARSSSHLHKRMAWPHITGKHIVLDQSPDKNEKTVSLLHWAQDVLLTVFTDALWGEGLLKIGPNLLQDFVTFDDNSWRLWYGVSGAKEMRKALERVIDTLEKFIAMPREDRADMAPVLQYYELTKRGVDIPPREIATILAMLYLVTNTNTYKQVFWMLAYMLRNPSILEVVRGEIKPAVNASTKDIDFKYLTEHCPMLNAVFDESLRLCSATTSFRTTTKAVVVHGKIIPPNVQVMAPFRELHWNPEVWGSDPSIWDPTRFLNNKSLTRSTSYKPFGGGVTFCPGRFISRVGALLFIALALDRFGVEMKGQQKFPRYDAKPNPALMGPLPGDDVIIVVRDRYGPQIA